MCVAEILDVLGEVAKEEDIVLTDLSGDFDLTVAISSGPGPEGSKSLTLAPSQVPMINPPFSTNFMLLVPEALLRH